MSANKKKNKKGKSPGGKMETPSSTPATPTEKGEYTI